MENGRTVQLSHHVVVDDQQYTITLFSPTRALKLLARITKLAGESMAVMAKAGAGGDPVDLLPQAVKQLLARLDEDEVVSLAKELCACVTVEKRPITFDLEFHGRLGTMAKLIGKVVEIQFTDFYSALGDSVRGAAKDLQA
jgi:hypothetical protein